MSWSFFIGTEPELYVGSQVFAERIQESPSSYGLSSEMAHAFRVVSDAWCSAYVLANEPATRTRSVIAAKNDAKRAVKEMAARLAKIVSGANTVTDEQKVNLGLSVRGVRSSVGSPGQPIDFRISLSQIGTIELQWKCKNPRGASGTVYQLWRRIGEGPFDYLGTVGKRRFEDTTIPAGTAQVTYKVQAMRSTLTGPFAMYNVNFGRGASIVGDTPVKIAA